MEKYQGLSEEELLVKVMLNPYAIKDIENPSEAVQLEAMSQEGMFIQYIVKPSERVQLEAVRQNIYAISYIDNPSEQVQLEAVRGYGIVIKYLENPSEAVQLEAVRSRYYALQYIENPSERVQLEAVRQRGSVIEDIKKPSERVVEEAIKTYPRAIKYRKDTVVVEKLFGTYKGNLYYNKSKEIVVAGCWGGTLEEFSPKCTERIDQATAEEYYEKMKAM